MGLASFPARGPSAGPWVFVVCDKATWDCLPQWSGNAKPTGVCLMIYDDFLSAASACPQETHDALWTDPMTGRFCETDYGRTQSSRRTRARCNAMPLAKKD